MNIPQVHKLSRASQLSLLAIVILLGGVYFTVNSALQQQNVASHASTAGIISGHVYRLSNRCSLSQAMDVSGNSSLNSADIIQWGWSSTWNKDREWIIKDLGNGYYSIRPLSSLKYLNVKGDSTAAGAQIIQWSGSSSPYVNEQWKIYNLGNGYFKIVGKHSLMAIGLYACSSSQGLNIRQYTYAGESRLQWKLTDVTSTPVQPTPTCAPPPTCFRNGVLICMIPVGGWCGFQPTPTQSPTNNPVPTDTPVPSQNPSVSPSNSPSNVPSSNPVPTDTPAPGSTVLAVTVGLHGVGLAGDSASPGTQGNMNPLHSSRPVKVDVYDSQNQLVVSQQGTITFNAGSGKFQGTIDLGTNFTAGLYTVKIKTDQYLRALVPGIQNIAAGTSNALPAVTLVAGDINNDNAINIVDYNILIGCYSDLLPATDCSAENNVLADITDDGHVNQFDYNLFLRELTNIGGQ